MHTASERRYETMTYNRCGHSGLLLPALSLGLWHNFGEAADPKTSREIVLTAFDAGITHFDIANNYGPPPGAAERCFGEMLRTDLKAYRDELVVSTKAGYLMWPGPCGEWGSRKQLLASLDQSLKRLGLDYVDIFYSHRPDPNTPLTETMGALDSAVHQGKALYVGISSYKPEATREAIQTLNSLGTPCLIHQPAYSMFNRWVEDHLLDVLEEEGVGAIAFCPLAQGLLSSKYLNGIPDDSRAARGSTLPKDKITFAVVAKLQKLNAIAGEHGLSLAQMALKWVLRDRRITSVLTGASKPEQVTENVAALAAPALDEAALQTIEQVLSAS